MHWLVDHVYGEVDLAVPGWLVRYLVYLSGTTIMANAATRLLVAGIVELADRLRIRVTSTRVDRWWTVRLGSRWQPPNALIAGAPTRRARFLRWLGRELAPPHLSDARLHRHVRRAQPVARVIDRVSNAAALVGRSHRALSVLLAAAAVAWVRPPWVEVPATWHQLTVAGSWITHSSLQAVLTTVSALVAITVFVGRGRLLDRLRFREEATRAAARYLISLHGALAALGFAVGRVHTEVLDSAGRHHRLYQAVAEASNYTITWREGGQLDFDHTPNQPGRRGDALGPSSAAVAVDEAIDRVNGVLTALSESGLAASVTRLLAPVSAEALDLGVMVSSRMDQHRLELGGASERTDSQKRFIDYLAGKLERFDGDEDQDDATIELLVRQPVLRACWEEARQLDRLAVGYLFTYRRIDAVCRHLRRRQGGHGLGTRIAMAVGK
jgi:hypothetical protein